ncbi:hypothetical protein D9M71_652540 [compost metagenome]
MGQIDRRENFQWFWICGTGHQVQVRRTLAQQAPVQRSVKGTVKCRHIMGVLDHQIREEVIHVFKQVRQTRLGPDHFGGHLYADAPLKPGLLL